MSYVVWFKEGCQTHIITPSGVRILSALEQCAQILEQDMVITCGCDSHPPDDPHSKGQAFDVRSHDLTPAKKTQLLASMMQTLSEGPADTVTPKDGGYVTKYFFGWLEHPGADNEHFHWQQRNGVPFP